ncbi:hypothetical protein D3C80_1789220 [compost metagenome]
MKPMTMVMKVTVSTLMGMKATTMRMKKVNTRTANTPTRPRKVMRGMITPVMITLVTTTANMTCICGWTR